MNYPYVIEVRCPMCKHVNTLDEKQLDYYSAKNNKPFVICCDSEEGGCDRYFVVKITLEPHVQTYIVDAPIEPSDPADDRLTQDCALDRSVQ